MTTAALAVSTCVLFGIIGYVCGVASCIALGMHINKKKARSNERK